ncbi:MAG: SDR family NAD(P)-dependent oxidoreductase, partial [Kineosporiaceae bacterium]
MAPEPGATGDAGAPSAPVPSTPVPSISGAPSPGPPVPGPSRVALVTGAGRGIGREVALGLARAGLAVGLLGRTRETVAAVAAEIAAAGGRAVPAVADVRDFAGVRAAVAAIGGELGGIDLLVNNAGAIESTSGPVWEADPEEWWRVVETDLRGPFHAVRAVVPDMLARRGGRIVDLSSGIGAGDRDVHAGYAAAKAGLFRIAGNLHAAGFDRGLRAFEVAPGVVRTDMTEAMPMHAGRTAWTPPQRLVDLVVAVAAGELDAWS